jgi:hypothetical protein
MHDMLFPALAALPQALLPRLAMCCFDMLAICNSYYTARGWA